MSHGISLDVKMYTYAMSLVIVRMPNVHVTLLQYPLLTFPKFVRGAGLHFYFIQTGPNSKILFSIQF